MLKPRKQLTQRKEIKRDHFTESLLAAWRWLQQYGQKAVLAAGAVAVVAVGIVLYRNSSRTALMEGKTAVSKADYYAQTGKVEDAMLAYKDIISQYGGFIKGQARLNLANLYYDQGDYTSAEQYYRECADAHSHPMLRPAALHGQAACMENRGEFDNAAALYRKAADRFPDSYLAPECLQSAARCYRQLGRVDDAAECYKTITREYAESEYARDAENRLKMLGRS